MRISTSWLDELVTLPSGDQLAHLFEMAGAGVENRQTDGEDEIYTLEVTSNRGDWLSAIGLAREVGAMTDKKLRIPTLEWEEPEASGSFTVEIENPDECGRYTGRLLENVKVGPSPEWMQKRLEQCGMRAVNNVVDITNYVMLETGQPLHAFDADKLRGQKIIVRRAQENEGITTLDGVERTLTSDLMVIADAERAIAVAGVMGSEDSEVSETTTRILLESAHFAPSVVRRGKRALGLPSEASRRFERFVDPNGVLRAANRAAQLLMQHAGATVSEAIVDRYAKPLLPRRVELRTARCNAILGLKISAANQAKYLQRLGLRIDSQTDELIGVQVPTFRPDITREIDLIEEVARINGYDAIPTTLPRGINAMAGRSLSQRLEERAKSALLRCGISEIVTYTMENERGVSKAGLVAAEAVRLRNPLSDDYTQLRTSMLPSLLNVLQRNSRWGARVFEMGKVFLPRTGQKQPDECRRLAFALMDSQTPTPHWQKSGTPADFFTLKAAIENLFLELGAPRPQWRPATEPSFHPGRYATISIDSQVLGYAGEIHPEVAARYDLSSRAYYAEIEFDAVVRHLSLMKKYVPLPRFPSADRDLALVVATNIASADIENLLRRSGGPYLREVRTFDIYTGAPIPEGSKSVALALQFRHDDRTLTDEEVEGAMQAVRTVAESQLGASLR
jgi:phenylalanyl-tRNA synthetase beta chain